ncbi:MAG: rhamnogalacturonan acetylesterase [Verrucomicrobia bacterium]|nr:MAG: rhamnogalacturonan acetylesterase [Verrucomicrobiota bacterium]
MHLPGRVIANLLFVGLVSAQAQDLPVAPAPDLATNPPAATTRLHPALPSIFIASDSTAARGAGANQQGWGVPFAKYFDPTKVNVVNRARGGRSSRTFITEGLWDQLLADVKTNDIVLIQFGHNDAGQINDASRARGSIPGLGEETKEIDNQVTKKHEVVHTFGWYIRKMIADTRAKGARPIVLSLTVRNIWRDGQIERGSGSYSLWLAESAKAAGVPFVELTQLVADKLEPLGETNVTALYPKDHTHFNAEGADIHAQFAVIGLKNLEGKPVDKFLSAAGKELGERREERDVTAPRVGPVHPGFNKSLPTLWLIGDSTVKNGRGDGGGGLWGWGDPIAAYFDKTKINVENQALGGTSSRSFLTTKLWEAVRAQIKPGDFVIMQFGHNDGGGAYGDNRARRSINGSGDETVEVTLATGAKEIVHTYVWYLRQYIADTKAAGGTPIVCSLIPRNDWTDGKVRRAGNSHGKWAKEAAETSGTFFIDLNNLIADRYDKLGQDAVKPFFPTEHTHTGWDGAVMNAECVVEGIKNLKDGKLGSFLLPNPEPPKKP